jgi:hypothetical protein
MSSLSSSTLSQGGRPAEGKQRIGPSTVAILEIKPAMRASPRGPDWLQWSKYGVGPVKFHKIEAEDL